MNPPRKNKEALDERCGGRIFTTLKKRSIRTERSKKGSLKRGLFLRLKIRVRQLEIKKLDASFYANNLHLKEVMDKTNGVWDTTSKTRGYGIAVVSINGLTFGIPLRSGMRHNDGFFTAKNLNKGLDYSKAVLLLNSAFISNESFLIPSDEFVRIKERTVFITTQFESYIKDYIAAIQSGDRNKMFRFRFSTLCNYHTELGI